MATNYLVTHSGIRFDLLNPTAGQVDLEDILFSLSNLNRYTGHVGPYSVQELFYELNPSWYWTTQIATQEALLHDMAEAYTGDISTPMKQLLGPAFCQVEARINQVIRPKFDLSEIPGHEYRIIRQADEMVTHAEALHFLGNGRSMFVNSWVIVVDLRVFPFKGTRVGLMLNNQKWCSQWPRIT